MGRSASFYGKLSEAAEELGDRVGANDTGAANYLYAAASLLRKRAEDQRAAYLAAQDPGVP